MPRNSNSIPVPGSLTHGNPRSPPHSAWPPSPSSATHEPKSSLTFWFKLPNNRVEAFREKGGLGMPLETVGSTETILKLAAAYQGSNCRRTQPLFLWSRISAYMDNVGTYDFYPASEYRPDQPSEGFLDDLESLLAAGFIRPLPDGSLEVTDSGFSTAEMFRVPRSVEVLEQELSARKD